MFNKLKYLFIEKRAKEEIKLDSDLIILTIIASLLAAFGINMGNNHLITASMLVSPLFNPIIAVVIFIIEKDRKNIFNAVGTLFVITILSIVTSISFFYVLKITNFLNAFAYVSPKINIFNVLGISVLIGVVGSLLWIWPKAPNISSGIAIAISLVPPIAKFSAGVILGDYVIALDYLLIYGLNLLGIIASSIVIFTLMSRGKLPETT
jgi:uncharacterized membrane protein